MLNHYLKIAFRNLSKNKTYSLINILGLAIGMAVALIIALWAHKELSYNKFLPKYDNLYQVIINYKVQHKIVTNTALAIPYAKAYKEEIPGVKDVVLCDYGDKHNLMFGDKKIFRSGYMIGPEFLNMFEYPMLKGDRSTALKETYSIVLTESTAKALFGDVNPMNKQVRIDNEHDLTVTGVLKDLPDNSTLQFNYLVPYQYLVESKTWVKEATTDWQNGFNQIFIELQPGAKIEPALLKLKDFVCLKNPEYCPYKQEMSLYPMKQWNLYTVFEGGKPIGGYIDYVILFSIIGIFVLSIACINFMNLSTARSAKRAKEVGVRKSIGAERKQLVIQFLTESVFLVLVSSFLCLLIVQLSIPFFNQLTSSIIHIPYENSMFWLFMIVYVLFTGILAGTRPAFYLSSFQPAKVLKGIFQSGKSAGLFRKALVVIQFTCSIGLIISTFIIYQQIQYAQSREKGYNANRLLMTPMSKDLLRNYGALRNELMQSGVVENVANASSALNYINNNTAIFDWPGRKASDENPSTGVVLASPDYFKTTGMELIAGKDFSDISPADTESIVVNEALCKALDLKQPLNQYITYFKSRCRIIGVVKDALMESPYTPVASLIFVHRDIEYDPETTILYRINPTIEINKAIEVISKIFTKYNEAYPYTYVFADEAYDEKFDMEVFVGKLSGIFAGLAIFISCLGLFGLAAYTTEQRTKEIGMRKILGASVLQIWLLLCKEFILLVLISCIVASPIVFYFLHNWLQTYQYHISVTPLAFILSAIIAIIVTIGTVSYQAIKSALANPVNNLRVD
ncbi:MAG TPA: ABC transporter permease [Bacteroidia bacterium]|nr:ABC transporter permease [Bacteroidia bacterium]